ncbi:MULTISPECIES: DUF308 domain-containing protein [Blautia]|uniref:DUF308 domain-containing protein n=1 Tax=Blautia TaxID=572511 RepID=UPI002585F56D|nr:MULTISPECIES: DUF308 domain-containing protein [Blautia]
MNVQVSQVLELIKGYWDTIPQQYKLVIYLAGAVFALLNCFMGYRLRKVWGCILGVLAGAGGGGAAGYYFLQDKVMALVCAAGGALILGLLAWLLYKFGVFFMCTGLVYCMILGFFQDASMTQHILALVAGVFAGTLALGYEKQMVIGVTAICGGIGGIHLIFSMMNKGTAGELVLGIILAIIGVFIQAAPLMREDGRETPLFGRFSDRKGMGLPTRRKKKVVKKTKVVQKKAAKEKAARDKALEKRRKIFTDDDYDDGDYDSDYQPPEEEPEFEAPMDREELDKTQEYHVGQKQYEPPKQQMPYMGSGIGIDLDDLNRELSQEIKKIYKDDNQ